MAGSNITTRVLLANNWQNELKKEKEAKTIGAGKVVPKEIYFVSPYKLNTNLGDFFFSSS